MSRFCAAALVLVMTSAVGAQEAPKQIPLKIQLVLSRYQGEKKLSSVPYVLWVTTGERSTNLRMGVKFPVATTMVGAGGATTPAYSYQDVGTQIDCNATGGFGGSFKIQLTVSDSSIYYPDRQRPDAPGNVQIVGAPPALRSFTSNFYIILIDGQTGQYTSATDQASGEVLKIDATLNVLK